MIRHKDYLLVQVEQHAERIKVNNDGLLEYVTLSGIWTGITLPPGTWQLIGLASELTEDRWREIVDWYGVGDGSVDEAGVGDIFWCYDESDFCFDTAIKSGKSLLKYHNLNANQTVILKLIQQ